MFRSASIAVLVLLFMPAVPTVAQEFDLSVENIMRGPELVGTAPRALRGQGVASWSPDSRHLYYRWREPGRDTADVVYRVTPTGQPERLEGADPDTIIAGPAEWSRDRRQALYVINGDLVLWTPRGYRYLTRTRARISNPHWSGDGRTVFFTQGGNAFALTLETAELRQLTDIRSGEAPREREPTPQRRFLIEQQQELFEFISSGRFRDQPWNREPTRDTLPMPFYPGQRRSAGNLIVTPDAKFVLLTVTEQPADARQTEMPLWITEDGYIGRFRGRTNVGDAQSSSRVAIIEVETGNVTFVADSVGESKRDVASLAVSASGRHALVRVESHDNKNRWYVVVDLPGLEERVVAHDHDEAWLRHPGPPLRFLAGFLRDEDTVYFGSERTRFTHVYLVPAAGGEPTAVTGGEWEVLTATLSPDGRTWHLTANREGFADVHHYTVPVQGGAITRMTTVSGRQDAIVSPDGRWLAMRHSEADRPWDLFIQENRPGRRMRQVTLSTTEEFRRGPWIKPEIVMIPADDGVLVPARLYRPTADPGPAGNRAAVIFVHGAGYLQNVHNWWSQYYREYMFHHLLASRGYTVLDIDYRGSAGHGRDWRTAIYRHMGGRDLDDHVDGARWLVREMGVDPGRIGIYGGSYGGFITIMAMVTRPGTFQAGAALRPVTDWAHYNDGYTSSILNTPQEDSVAYRRSSPIYHAEGLEGHLLLMHGMVDENVWFYDTARLAQRLIELGKENWEVAIYPAERHAFTEVTGWVDEYRRILNLFERVLRAP